MKITVCSPQDFGYQAASKVAALIIDLQKDPQKSVNMVFATGNTMIEFLEELSKNPLIDWKRINAFHLDEYKGLSVNHPSSFAYFLNKNIFSKVAIPQENINYINGAHPDLQSYMDKLKSLGAADILMLGVGMDGHLAFNEPPAYSSFDRRMGEVKLTKETLDSNRCDYPQIDQNPCAFSMGVADILEAKHIFFLVNKAKKANIVIKALTGPVTSDIPATILQTHPSVTCILDTDAASLLPSEILEPMPVLVI